jgi:hypothetical protein
MLWHLVTTTLMMGETMKRELVALVPHSKLWINHLSKVVDPPFCQVLL